MLVGCVSPLEREQRNRAVPYAEAWIAHLDAGEREGAWAGTAGIARQRLDKDVALKLWFGSREALGPRLSRKVELDWERKPWTLRAAPDGTYWEVAFRSHFENRRDVEERLLLFWEGGRWRLFHYSLK